MNGVLPRESPFLKFLRERARALLASASVERGLDSHGLTEAADARLQPLPVPLLLLVCLFYYWFDVFPWQSCQLASTEAKINNSAFNSLGFPI